MRGKEWQIMAEAVHTLETEKEGQARKIVNKYMWLSMGVGLLPFPILDMAGIMALQLRMLQLLSRLYDVPFSRDLGKKIISALLGTIVPASLTGSLWSTVKMVPILGPIAALSMPIFAGAATYAIGKVFIQHFESGGTFLDFEPAKVQEHFRQEFEKGRHYAAGTRTETTPPGGPTMSNI
jgi:uncharacterized protein (DUF697 family)